MNHNLATTPGAARPDAPIIKDIAHLGGRGTLYLLALIQAHPLRQRVTPTHEATANLLSVLDALGVVSTEHHQFHASNTTFADNLPWSYTWPHVPFEGLEVRLVDYLSSTGRSGIYADTWLRVWQELISTEVILYLQHQLRLHQFGDQYLEEVRPSLVSNETRYCLGHWRYACWVSVRTMASVSLQHPGNTELLKYTLRNELPRRLQVALGSPGEKFCFSPSYAIPTCTLSTVLSSVATQLGDNFWKFPPNHELL